MGIESEFREVPKQYAPDCFFPLWNPSTQEWIYPSFRQFEAAIDDFNYRIRNMPVLYPGSERSYAGFALQTYGAVMHRYAQRLHEIMITGPNQIAIHIDYKSPPNKAITQEMRKEAMQRNANNAAKESNGKRKAAAVDADGEALFQEDVPMQVTAEPYKWPMEDDGKQWFTDETTVHCPWDQIYYSESPFAKNKWLEYVTRYILYRFPLPPGKSLLLPVGVLDGQWFSTPLVVYIQHPLGEHATEAEVWQAERNNPGCVKRIVRPAYEFPNASFKYGEADDRMILYIYYYTIMRKQSVLVFSGDGDTTIAMMNTLRMRKSVLREGPEHLRLKEGERFPMAMHVMPHPVQRMQANGHMARRTETLVIDTDRLALTIGSIYSGKAMAALGADAAQAPDGLVLYTLLVTMGTTDYTRNYPFLSPLNILEAFEKRPDLLAKAVRTRVVPVRNTEWLGSSYLDVQLHTKNFSAFIVHASEVARSNKSYRCRAPSLVPTVPEGRKNQELDEYDKKMIFTYVQCMCARSAWTVDKFVNAGVPDYTLADPFAQGEAGLSLYGYELDPVTKKPRDAELVYPRVWISIQK